MSRVYHQTHLEMIDSALAYADRGWPVFPLAPGKKTPLARTHGHLDATTDPGSIHQLWAPWPDANIGLALGHGAIVVIDIDRRHGGDRELARLEAEIEPLPPGPTVTTGDGVHRYFRATKPVIQTCRLGPGLELRADGAYVVAPPSLHPNGKRYQWRNELDPLPPLPSWTRALNPAPVLADSARLSTRPIVASSGNRTDLGAALAASVSSLDNLPAILPLLGLPANMLPGGPAARCPLCRERHPSASLLYSQRSGVIVLRSWHTCHGREWWLLPEVHAARATGNYVRLGRAELAGWSLSLLLEAHILPIPEIPPRMPGASVNADVVHHAFNCTVSAAEVLAPDAAGVAFTRRFGAALTAFSEDEVRAAWDWLRAHGYVEQVSARVGHNPALWRVARQNEETDAGAGVTPNKISR